MEVKSSMQNKDDDRYEISVSISKDEARMLNLALDRITNTDSFCRADMFAPTKMVDLLKNLLESITTEATKDMSDEDWNWVNDTEGWYYE